MKQQWIDQMKKLQDHDFTEIAHREADDILCELLKSLGYEEVVDEYHKIEKWFE